MTAESPLALVTTNWTAVSRAAKSGEPLPFQPVRISLGLPRWFPEGRTCPYVEELAPKGLWDLDEPEFSTRFIERLDRFGVEQITARLREVHDGSDRPLALVCFEPPGQHCHRRLGADWWERKTGQQVDEWRPAASEPSQEPAQNPHTGGFGQLRVTGDTRGER
jgi:hypothetical protein